VDERREGMAREAEEGWAYALPLFHIYFLVIFNDSCLTSCLNVYRANLLHICRIGRTPASDKRSEVSFFRSFKRSRASLVGWSRV